MRNNLRDNIISAIEDMKSAREAYLELQDAYYDKEKSDRVYTQRYSTIMNNIHSITDTLLNNFVDEKGIRSGEPRPSTLQLCEMIVKHNLEHEENQYLTDVDFWILCDRTAGNVKVHNGIKKEMQDLYRLFFNYNKILLALECNVEKETVILEREMEEFDFQAFQAYFDLDEEEAEDRRFILMVDSLHDVEKSQLATFLQLPWSAIIDFDGITEFGGVGEAIKNSGIERNAYSYFESIDTNYSMRFYNKIMHINACDTSKKITQFIGANSFKHGDDDLIDNLCERLHDASHPYVTIVLVGKVTARMNTMCNFISAHFKDTKMLVLSEQGDDNRNIPNEDTDDEEHIISDVHVFNSSIQSALKSIYDNREFLPNIKNHLFSDENEYRVPKCSPIEKSRFARFENDLELIHLGLGGDLSEQNDNAFLRGDLISWATIKNKCVKPIISENKFSDFVEDMKRSKGHRCFYVYHRPGFGGTTLGRQLIWELHSIIPCVRIKKYHGIDWFKRMLNDLYKMFNNSLFWILVDHNDINNGDAEEIRNEVEKGDYNVCALMVKGVTDALAKERVYKRANNEIVLRVLEKESKSMLESKCMSLVDNNEIFKKRQENLIKNLQPSEECPLIVNLYLLEDNFKLDTYVKSRIDTIPEDSDREKVCHLLAFAAMGRLYSDVKFPASYFRQYLGQKNMEQEKKCFEGILLCRKEGQETLYFVNHYLIAKELLKQLLSIEDGIGWVSKLPLYSKLLIDWICDLIGDVEYIDERLQDIICCLFTDKTKGSQQETKKSDVVFTQLFEAMDQPPRIDVICYLANRMTEKIVRKIPKGKGRKEYSLLAHIYAQQAKIRLWSERMDEYQDGGESKEEELSKYIERTIDLIDSEGIRDRVLEDILARCSLKRGKDLRNKLGDEIDEDSLNKIMEYIDDAIYHFNYSISYGSCDYGVPGKMEAYTVGLGSIISSRSISEKNRIEKLYEDEFARKYIDDAIESIRDIEEYQLTDYAIAVCQKNRENLLSLLYPERPSDLLNRLNSLREKTNKEDYETQYFISNQIVYAYERKHYNPDRYRGSELIKKALEGDKDAINDAKVAFENLNSIIRMNVNHPVSSVTYKKWFEYAKYWDVSLETAKGVARAWKDNIINNNFVREYRTSAIQPYYYLFIITLLQYKLNYGDVSKVDVFDRKKDLQNILSKTMNYSRAPIDWYANGKQLGQLYSREWIDIKDVANEDRIAVVKGRVVALDEKYVGYMRVTQPPQISNWSQSKLGYRHNPDSDVRFKEEQTTIISHSDIGSDKEWAFKLGFAYENFELSMNSLEMLHGATTPTKTKEYALNDQESHLFIPKYVHRNSEGKALLVIGTVDGERAAIHRKEVEKQTNISSDIDVYMDNLVEIGKEKGIAIVIKEITEKGINCAIDETLYNNCSVEKVEGDVEYEEFKPFRFIRNVVQGNIRDGVLASISKTTLSGEDKEKIKELIATGGTLLVRVIKENPQKNGYIVEMKK